MPSKEMYFVEAEEMQWAVRYRQLGSKITLCLCEKKEHAEQISIAMNIYPLAEQAAEELSGETPGNAGRQGLQAAFSRIKAQQRQAFFINDMRSCMEGLGRLVVSILVGLIVLIVIVLIFRYVLL